MWVYIIVPIVALIIVYSLIAYNSFVKLNNKVEEAFSTMDIYLKKRWDLIPNLVEVVKGYAKHEEDVFTEIAESRNSIYDDLSSTEKIKTNERLSRSIGRVIAIAEAYPDLKVSENFKALSKELTKVEDEIANSRKYYNGTVRIYNNKIKTFPSMLFAKLFGCQPRVMFKANAEERKHVEVKL